MRACLVLELECPNARVLYTTNAVNFILFLFGANVQLCIPFLLVWCKCPTALYADETFKCPSFVHHECCTFHFCLFGANVQLCIICIFVLMQRFKCPQLLYTTNAVHSVSTLVKRSNLPSLLYTTNFVHSFAALVQMHKCQVLCTTKVVCTPFLLWCKRPNAKFCAPQMLCILIPFSHGEVYKCAFHFCLFGANNPTVHFLHFCVD